MKIFKLNRLVLTFLAVIFLISSTAAQYPGKKWQQYKTPEEAGFSSEKLKEAEKMYNYTDAAAFMVVYKGHVVVSWGDVKRRYMCHSVRKSLLSALYGIYVKEGIINLDETLEQLKIDDKSPLTKEEKQAKVRDLLKARSGVYHPAAYETQQMKAMRPGRGSHKRDTFWYYNNWDFNVLCTILEQKTKTDIFTAFKKRLAEPLQMEDYRVMDGYHHLEAENSNHPAYPFRLSARDMARVGLLYLGRGQWKNKQIFPIRWINESFTSYSKAGPNASYGYLWWIIDSYKDKGGLYAAMGVGTQLIVVLPGSAMVIVQRVDTYAAKNAPPNIPLIEKILAAKALKPKPKPALIPLQNTPSYKRPALITLKPGVLKKYVKDYQMGDEQVAVELVNGGLVAKTLNRGSFRLLPVSRTHFVVEDAEQIGLFQMDEKGTPVDFLIQPTMESATLYLDIMKSGPEAAVKRYKEKREKHKDTYTFAEAELNGMGYGFMRKKDMKAAIAVFKLNVELYPRSFNAYDSLGEAYMKSSDFKRAAVNYKKSLELNPGNKNAEAMLKKMKM
ncbi:MAG: serine hydrolase [bacterium]|nr:serine hydrolase [bacterium]